MEHNTAALKSIDRRAAEIRTAISQGNEALVYVLATTTAHVGVRLLDVAVPRKPAARELHHDTQAILRQAASIRRIREELIEELS
jgi:chemotaxis regulatin CheY-phosphate phosphatase CheZ